MQRRWKVAVAVTAMATSAFAESDAELATRARQALRRASEFMVSISTEGGWVWKYAPDLRQRWGESPATAAQIWIQPPGTPTVGGAFLAAWRATGERFYLDATERAAEALARGQLASGGWDYMIDFEPAAFARWRRRGDADTPAAAARRLRNVSVLDDDTTTSALRFLLDVVMEPTEVNSSRRRSARVALEHGLRGLLAAQYPNGAWPQRFEGPPSAVLPDPTHRARFPERGVPAYTKQAYSAWFTLNDHVQADVIRTLLDAWRATGDTKLLAAARRGGRFLILAQLPPPQPAWAQQYNFDMEPAWARAFEPPAVCTAESVGVIRILIRLFQETGDREYLAPIPPAIEWFERSRIGTNRWARLYELGTNRPIYGDRDGRIHYTLSEISDERRTGYGWEGDFGIPSLIRDWKARGGGVPLTKPTPAPARRPPSPSERAAARLAIESLDASGRWLSNGMIETHIFVRNVRALCQFIEAAEPTDPTSPTGTGT